VTLEEILREDEEAEEELVIFYRQANSLLVKRAISPPNDYLKTFPPTKRNTSTNSHNY
jgi:hypothetical protein